MNFLEIIENGTLPDIEKAVGERLKKNSAFFKHNNHKLYELLTREPSLYQLYIGEDGINVYNLAKKNFVYPKKEGRHTFVAISKQYAHNPLNNPLWKIYNNHNKLAKMDESRFPQTSSLQNSIVDTVVTREAIHKGVLHFPSNMLPVATVFGLAGGLFLEYIIENSDYIHTLMLYEESYDFFRISCCFVDYEKLFSLIPDGGVYLFVEDIVDRKVVKTFFTRRKITSNYIRAELTLYSTPKIEEVKKIVELEQNSNSRGWGTFEDEMIGVRNAKKNLTPQDNRLKYPVLYKRDLQTMPICVVGNGPSLDGLLPFIKENQDKMIIFSCGTALKPLRNYGIKPDFQIELERLPFLKGILEDSQIDDIPILGANIIDSSTLEASREAYIFMRGSAAPTYFHKPKFILNYSYPFVGNAGLSLALLFSREIYLCGLDMGYKKGSTKHAKGSFYGEEEKELPKDAVLTEGNFNDDIYSDPLFALSREFAEVAVGTQKETTVYNMSDGALIKGAKPLHAEDAKLKDGDKQHALKKIKSCFSTDTKYLGNMEEDFEKKSFAAFKEGLGKILLKNVKNKKELMLTLDEIYAFLEDFKKKNSGFGILLEGSVMHVLDMLFVTLLHVKRDDISELYNEFSNKIVSGLSVFESRYNLSTLFQDLE